VLAGRQDVLELVAGGGGGGRLGWAQRLGRLHVDGSALAGHDVLEFISQDIAFDGWRRGRGGVPARRAHSDRASGARLDKKRAVCRSFVCAAVCSAAVTVRKENDSQAMAAAPAARPAPAGWVCAAQGVAAAGCGGLRM